MATWIDITAEENWQPQFYPLDPSPGCPGEFDPVDLGSASNYAWDGAQWIGAGAGINGAALLKFIGDIDGSVIGLRVTMKTVEEIVIDFGTGLAFQAVVALIAPQSLAPSAYDYMGVCPGDLITYPDCHYRMDEGTYPVDTEIVVELSIDNKFASYSLSMLDGVTALYNVVDTDNCGPYATAMVAHTITKIEALVEAPSSFWTDFIGCGEA